MEALFIRTSYYSEDSHPENVRASLDIGYSASILEDKGFEISFIDMKAEDYTKEEIIKEVKDEKYDVVFLKIQTPCVEVSKDIASNIEDSTVFAFVQHPTEIPETFLYEDSPFDACIRGELEPAVEKIGEKIGEKDFYRDIDGVTYFEGGDVEKGDVLKVEDLDELPLPKHDLFLNDNYGDILPMDIDQGNAQYGYILTSRGCPFQCIYCSPTLRVTYGKKMRYRDPESVVDEMEYLVKKGVDAIAIKDDMFTFSPEHVEEICDEIIDRGLEVTWFAQTRADSVSKELFEKMKEAGCSTVGIGVESGSPRILDILKKGETKKDVRDAFKYARMAGINTVGYFMLGNPTETKKEMKQTLKFCKELRPDMIQVAFFTPYPGSNSYEEYVEKGSIKPENYHHYNTVTRNVSDVSDKELRRFQKRFYISYALSIGFIANFFKRKISNPLDISNEKMYIKKGLKMLFN